MQTKYKPALVLDDCLELSLSLSLPLSRLELPLPPSPETAASPA